MNFDIAKKTVKDGKIETRSIKKGASEDQAKTIIARELSRHGFTCIESEGRTILMQSVKTESGFETIEVADILKIDAYDLVIKASELPKQNYKISIKRPGLEIEIKSAEADSEKIKSLLSSTIADLFGMNEEAVERVSRSGKGSEVKIQPEAAEGDEKPEAVTVEVSGARL